jgi:hypothetical protein
MTLITPRRTLAALTLSAATGVLLAGCSLFPPSAEPGNGASSDEAVTRFVACLNDGGQVARIGDSGRAEVLIAGPSDDGGSFTDGVPGGDSPSGAGPGTMTMTQDSQGTWQSSDAAGGYEDVGIQDAWTACEADVPEFEQPEADLSGADMQGQTIEQQIERSLAFAGCARDNGFADFPDPDDHGMLGFPDGMTEDAFRGLLESCVDTLEGGPIAISTDATESFDFDWMAVLQEYVGGIIGGGAVPGEQG